MVQHVCVVVGATSYCRGNIHKLLLFCLLCCGVRDRAVCVFMRADDSYFFSGVFDVHFTGSMLFCLSFHIHRI